MARRTISGSDWIEYIPEVHNPDPRGYVCCELVDSPVSELLIREVKYVIRKARLTLCQRAVFWSYVRGLSIRDMCALYQREESTIHQHLQKAHEKVEKVEHRGVLTSMIETHGWRAVRELLMDRLEAEFDTHN